MHSEWWCVRVAFFLVMFVSGIPARAQGTDSGLVPVIDVMVVYTSAAQAEGGPALPSLIKAAVDDANTVLLNSRARAHFRLVHQAKVDYTEPQGWESAGLLTLDRLVTPGDGYVDEVNALRDQYKADLAVLIVKGSPSFKSVACLNADADHAFAVIGPGGVTFVSLLGRLLGCEAEIAPVEETGRVIGDGAFPDSHAARITNALHGVFSTVMAVQGWTLPVFSNPELRVLGQPLGETGKADNVRTINLRAPIVSAFRGAAGLGRPPTVTWKYPQ